LPAALLNSTKRPSALPRRPSTYLSAKPPVDVTLTSVVAVPPGSSNTPLPSASRSWR
jgi:hypothetical protein